MMYSSLKGWWDEGIPLIDIRETQGNNALLSTARRVVVHLPFSSLISGERSCEMPPRNQSFGILLEKIDDNSEQQDNDKLLLEFFFADKSKATHQSRKPWTVHALLIATSELWEESKVLGIHQPLNHQSTPTSNLPFPLPRLWQPDPLISSLLWPILESQMSCQKKYYDCAIWDLGSGAGRDACYIAENVKLCGWTHCRVVGLDNHKASAKRCEPFWRRRNVAEIAQSRNVNLNNLELVEELIKQDNVACFYAVRFLNRKLLAYLAHESNLKPGTVFAMSYFCKPSDGAEWKFEHPKVGIVNE